MSRGARVDVPLLKSRIVEGWIGGRTVVKRTEPNAGRGHLVRRPSMRFIIVGIALATAFLGYFVFFAVLDMANENISRCSDESALQYIEDREQRRRECSTE